MRCTVTSVSQERFSLFSVELFCVGFGWSMLGFYVVSILFPGVC
jgi:hypothetical protein